MPYYFFYQNIMSYHNALQFPSRQRMVDCMDEERFIRRNFIRIESCNSTESFLQHIHPIVLCEGCDDRLPWRISENGCFMAKVFLQILSLGLGSPLACFRRRGYAILWLHLQLASGSMQGQPFCLGGNKKEGS